MLISYTSKFTKRAKSLSKTLKLQLVKAEEKFNKDPFDPSLKTHKLKGELGDCYSFSINYSHRVVFTMESGGKVVFIDVGGHSIYN